MTPEQHYLKLVQTHEAEGSSAKAEHYRIKARIAALKAEIKELECEAAKVLIDAGHEVEVKRMDPPHKMVPFHKLDCVFGALRSAITRQRRLGLEKDASLTQRLLDGLTYFGAIALYDSVAAESEWSTYTT